jgi:hypothetical protein
VISAPGVIDHVPTNRRSTSINFHEYQPSPTARTAIATTIRRLRQFGRDGEEFIREGGELR